MVPRPEPRELLGMAGLVVGFVVFTFGVLIYVGGGRETETVAQIVAGGLIGFASAGFLIVHYFVIGVVGR